jgi:hypothetical protein
MFAKNYHISILKALETSIQPNRELFKQENVLNFFLFLLHFWPAWIRFRIRNTESITTDLGSQGAASFAWIGWIRLKVFIFV